MTGGNLSRAVLKTNDEGGVARGGGVEFGGDLIGRGSVGEWGSGRMGEWEHGEGLRMGVPVPMGIEDSTAVGAISSSVRDSCRDALRPEGTGEKVAGGRTISQKLWCLLDAGATAIGVDMRAFSLTLPDAQTPALSDGIFRNFCTARQTGETE
jgi:hypothetical protein